MEQRRSARRSPRGSPSEQHAAPATLFPMHAHVRDRRLAVA